jgi:hypothetical protein
MKRMLVAALLLGIFSSVSLVGCGDDTASKPSETPKADTPKADTPKAE